MVPTLMHTTLKLAHRVVKLEDLGWRALPYLQLVSYLQEGEVPDAVPL